MHPVTMRIQQCPVGCTLLQGQSVARHARWLKRQPVDGWARPARPLGSTSALTCYPALTYEAFYTATIFKLDGADAKRRRYLHAAAHWAQGGRRQFAKGHATQGTAQHM